MNSGETLIEIRPSRFGNGLFSLVDIPAGTITCAVAGVQLSFEETLMLGTKEGHCIQIEIDRYILCDPLLLYSNHSCEPNCGINSELQLLLLLTYQRGMNCFGTIAPPCMNETGK